MLAPARSFSSVVTAMLGCHPELYGFPELTLFEQATVGDRLDAPPHPSPYRQEWNPVVGLERALAELHDGRQDDEARAAARAWLVQRRPQRGCDVLDHLLELIEPRTGVEKSPGTSSTDAALERAAAAYPRARFIHLTRHPTTTARSLRDVYRLTGREYACAKAWVAYHIRIAAFCESRQALRVRGEDVLNDGGAELERIARWLDVGADAESVDAMRRPERSPYAGPGGGWDHHFMRDPVPHRVELPQSRDLPADWNVPDDLRGRVATLAEALGY